MRTSLNLIKKYVDLSDISVEEIVDKLTFSGLEVEEVTKVASASNLVIGEIIECVEHPDSDHLHILKVDLGSKYGVKQIVCGAPNARVGLKVIVARVGAVLDRHNISISKGVIRGVESEGMCCSLEELGVDKSYLSSKQLEGIEELDSSSVVGEENVLEYLNLDDYILDINVLANRSDCLSVLSLAKELGALFNREVNIPNINLGDEISSPLKVSSLTDKCKQISLKLVKNIQVKESPKWLSTYLMNNGIRSINNIVDIGNYVMILTGQPIHIYDIDKLKSNEFIVKDDLETKFTALDHNEYDITKGDICITNDNQIGCLGGIMGSALCEVDEQTTNVVIESANFDPATIRRTTIKLGLSSDSSARFIKGINPSQDQFVLDLTAQLLIDLADAKQIYQTSKYSVLDNKEIEIKCSCSYINNRLGYDFSKEEIFDVFDRLKINIKKINDDEFIAIPPAHRIDLRCDANLSEEVFRFIGLDRIKPRLPEMVTTVGGLSLLQKNKKNIREHLISRGFNEILTYTLVSPSMNDKFVVLNDDNPIKIKNPMTIDHSLVRRGLISSVLDVLEYNLSHQNKNLKFFEISDITTDKQTYQELCLVLNGNKTGASNFNKVPFDYYDVKGIFESIMQIMGLDSKRYRIERMTDSEFFHTGRSAKIIVNNKMIGVMGELHPLYSKDYGLTYILDLNLTKVLELKCSNKKMQPISKYPSIERDYAFVMKKEILADQIINAVKKESKGIISNIAIFDVYEGEFLPDGYKSLTLKITYSSIDSTLTDKEINPVEEKFIMSINKLFGAYLRK